MLIDYIRLERYYEKRSQVVYCFKKGSGIIYFSLIGCYVLYNLITTQTPGPAPTNQHDRNKKKKERK